MARPHLSSSLSSPDPASPSVVPPLKDTGRALCPTHQVEAGGNDVGRLPPSGQAFTERHLVEVEGRVQAVFVHLQLMA